MLTEKERIDQLEKWCYNLQLQIDWMKNNPVISLKQDFENTQVYNCTCQWHCKCTNPNVFRTNSGALICLNCNKPPVNPYASGPAGQTVL